MRSASRRGHDTRSRRPAVRLTRKMAVAATHSDSVCWKKTTPYVPKVNAGHHTTRAPATAATDVARVIRSVAVAPSPSLDMGVVAVLSFGIHDGIHGSCQPPHSAASAAVGPHEPGL